MFSELKQNKTKNGIYIVCIHTIYWVRFHFVFYFLFRSNKRILFDWKPFKLYQTNQNDNNQQNRFTEWEKKTKQMNMYFYLFSY